MPQHFLCAQALTLTLTLTVTLTMTTNMDPMTLTRGDDHHDGSKLTLPHFDPKDPTYFDDLQAYAQDRGLGWLLHADGDDTNARSHRPSSKGGTGAQQRQRRWRTGCASTA